MNEFLPNRVRRWTFRIIGIILGLLLIVIILSLLFPGHGSRQTACRFNSINQIQDIAYLVQIYRQNHNGQNPDLLSQLVDYSPTVDVFYLPCPYANSYAVTNLNAQRDFVDLFSPFRFLGLNDKRVVVCEQPGLWPDGTIAYCVTSSDPTNMEPDEIGKFPATDFEIRLRGGFREGAKTGSVWHIQYRVDGQNKNVQLSLITPSGKEQKTVSTPYTSPTYEFYKFQHVGFCAQHLNESDTAILLVNGRAMEQKWTTGTNISINWIVGSSCEW